LRKRLNDAIGGTLDCKLLISNLKFEIFILQFEIAFKIPLERHYPLLCDIDLVVGANPSNQGSVGFW